MIGNKLTHFSHDEDYTHDDNDDTKKKNSSKPLKLFGNEKLGSNFVHRLETHLYLSSNSKVIGFDDKDA